MTVPFYGNEVFELIKTLADHFFTSIKVDCQVQSFDIPPNYGSGKISALQSSKGIGMMIFEGQFEEELEIIAETNIIHSLQFAFCKKGEVTHELCDKEVNYQMNSLSSSISANPKTCRQYLHFPQEIDLTFVILWINRRQYAEEVKCDIETTPEKLVKLFEDLEGTKPFLFQNSYTVAISNCLKDLQHLPYDGLIQSTFLEAKALELLSLQIKQYDDHISPNLRSSSLKQKDMLQIIKAQEILLNNFQNTPTIPKLAQQVGVNQQKLKLGFKELFGMSIAQYTQMKKMETAKILVSKGDLLIGEVAEQLGYKNQSHFAKKFKDHFKVLPKDLRKSILLSEVKVKSIDN